MKLSKDKRSLIYNNFLTLSGIPPEVFEYRLGNRSALEWIIASTKSAPTNAAASPTTATAPTIRNTLCG
jgi:predicted helicase